MNANEEREMDEDQDRPVVCDNCEWTGKQSELGSQLEDVPDLSERLDPGGEVPCGECPECGCLAYLETRKSIVG